MNIFYKILIFIIISIRLEGGGMVTEMLTMVRNIEGGLHEEFLTKGRPLPDSLGKIELLNEIVRRNPNSGMLINQMAVVPGTPQIIKSEGTSHRRSDWRIFAIGRITNKDYAPEGKNDQDFSLGRYSVWITKEGTHAAAIWIPETEVQAIFKQIGAFDPSAQPVPFPEAEEMVSEKMARERNLREKMRMDYEKAEKRIPKKLSVDDKAINQSKVRVLILLILGAPAMLLLVWLTFYLAGRKRISR